MNDVFIKLSFLKNIDNIKIIKSLIKIAAADNAKSSFLNSAKNVLYDLAQHTAASPINAYHSALNYAKALKSKKKLNIESFLDRPKEILKNTNLVENVGKENTKHTIESFKRELSNAGEEYLSNYGKNKKMYEELVSAAKSHGASALKGLILPALAYAAYKGTGYLFGPNNNLNNQSNIDYQELIRRRREYLRRRALLGQ